MNRDTVINFLDDSNHWKITDYSLTAFSQLLIALGLA